MSLHPSLKVDMAGTQHRTVLTRLERIKGLMKGGKWSEDRKVTSLPKTKILKIKAKRTKAKEEAAGGSAAAPAAGAGAAKGKEKAPAKK